MPNGGDDDVKSANEIELLEDIQVLQKLRDDSHIVPRIWLVEVRSLLDKRKELQFSSGVLPELGEFPENMERLDYEHKTTTVRSVIDTAIRRLEDQFKPTLITALRVAAEDAAKRAVSEAAVQAAKEAVQSELKPLVDDAIWNSAAVKIGKWAMPIIFAGFVAAMIGGTVYEGIKVTGVADNATQAQKDISYTADRAHKDIATARQNAVDENNRQVTEEIQEQKATIDTAYNKELRALQTESSNKRTEIDQEAEKAKNAAEKDATSIWTDKERDGITELNSNRGVILAALTNKLNEAKTTIDRMVGALPKQVNEIKPKGG